MAGNPVYWYNLYLCSGWYTLSKQLAERWHAVWQGRFAEAAFAARGGNSGERPQALLHGKRVYVHVAEAAKKGPSAGNGGPLRRLVTALGGKVKLHTELC